jgi:protoheme IX farnesyltransferase
MLEMSSLTSINRRFIENYWPLIKSRQTFLLTLTGAAGYLCQQFSSPDWGRFLGLSGSLIATISGCSVLNMLFDRDIDRLMQRTSMRPLATSRLRPHNALLLGGVLIAIGLLWAARLSAMYFALVLAGAVLNLVVYTVWLKRRSAWSILVGGIAGGMPIMAGRVLAIGQIDFLGLLLSLIIVCWIPSHNLTLANLYSSDYINAGIPTFINVYGTKITLFVIALSSLLTAFLMVAAYTWLDAGVLYLFLSIAGGVGLALFALSAWLKTLPSRISLLYKVSSIYMLVSMLLLVLNGIF